MTFWDDNATPAGVFNVGDMYDEYTRRQADFIVEQLDITSGVLLDLGCGVGRLSAVVLDRLLPDVSVVGSDPSWPMLEKAQQRIPGMRIEDNISVFPELTFDGAWCVLTFQHLPDDTVKQHLTDLFEILEPGARLVTQWVTTGQQAPMSYPRPFVSVVDMIKDIGFSVHGPSAVLPDDYVTRYADDWVWVVAEKPA